MLSQLLSSMPKIASALSWALLSVSDVFWSGLIAATVAFIGTVVAAVLSFIGVLYAGRLGREGLTAQLNGQRGLAEDQRLFDFKKACYIEIAEQAVAANMKLANMIKGQHRELFNMEALGGFARAHAKLALVADTRTLNAASDLSSALVSTLLSLINGLDPLFQLNIDIDIENENLDDLFKKIFKMQEEQQSLSFAGDFTSHHRTVLDRHIVDHIARANALRNELQIKRRDASALMHEANVVFSARMIEISSLNIELLTAIRASIGVSTDLDTYIAKTAAAGAVIREQSVELTRKLAEVMVIQPTPD